MDHWNIFIDRLLFVVFISLLLLMIVCVIMGEFACAAILNATTLICFLFLCIFIKR